MAKSLVVRIIADPTELSAGLRTATAETSTFGAKMGSALKAGGFVAAAGIGVAVIAIEKFGKAATGFQDAMEQIHTQAGASQAEVNKMSKALLALGPAVGQTPTELANGLYHVESAGLRGAKALQVLATAAKGAAVGHADLESVTNALVAAQKSGISGVQNMNQAMGTLNAIVGVGNMRMGDLASAMSTGILPAARGVGLNLKDVGAALAVMTDAGVPATAAATRLRMTFSLMAAPTKAASKALESIGIGQTDLAHKMRTEGLLPALDLLKTKLAESGQSAEEQSVTIARAFGGGRTAGSIITLLQQLDNVKAKQDALTTGAAAFGDAWAAEQQTAEFASQKFHAALSSLEITLGTALLPTITKVMNGLADLIIWLQRSESVHRALTTAVAVLRGAWEAMKPTIDKLVSWTGELTDYIRDHWAQISAYVSKAMVTVRSIISQVTTGAKEMWTQFGSAITSIARRDFSAAIAIIKNAFAVIQGVFQLVGDLLHGRWAKVWDDLKQIVSNSLQIIVTVIETSVANAYTAALAIGKALVGGVVDGLKSLASEVGGAIHHGISGAVHLAGNILHGSGPFQFTNETVGVPLGQGIIDGFNSTTNSLANVMAAQIKKAVDATKAIIAGAQSDFQTSFQGFQQIADQMSGGIAGASQTKAGKQLSVLTAAHDSAALAKGITDARAQLSDAQAANAAVLTDAQANYDAAQKALDDARAAGADASEVQQRQFDLGTARGALKAAYTPDNSTVLAAQQALADALYNQKVANLTKEAAAEQLNLTATNQVKQIAFDNALAKLEEHLKKTGASTKVAMEAITKLLSSYGVSFKAVGADMGNAWVGGLREAILAASKGAGALQNVIAGQALTLGGALGGVPHAALGGYVAEGGLAVIHRGENIIPAGRGAGVTINVAGSVVTERELFGLVQKYARLDLNAGGKGVPG